MDIDGSIHLLEINMELFIQTTMFTDYANMKI